MDFLEKWDFFVKRYLLYYEFIIYLLILFNVNKFWKN